MKKLLILNGPNLNLLGTRQPDIYGSHTLDQIQVMCSKHADTLECKIAWAQSNHEGDLIDTIHNAAHAFDGIILNAGAYTHTSIAIADAVQAVDIPVIEVHLTNIHAREEFRSQSFISPMVLGQIVGFGPAGYRFAIDAMLDHLQTDRI